MAEAHPELFLPFEEWLGTLEEELLSLLWDNPSLGAGEAARRLGLSPGRGRIYHGKAKEKH